jgi:hypothetical protein
MRRTLVQFDDETYRRLKRYAFQHDRSIAAVVREMVAKGLDGAPARQRPTSVRHFTFVGAGRSRQGALSPVSERHDEALTGAFAK